MNLGKILVKIRKDHKMSQEDFAEMFYVSRQTISSWENSKSYPDIETLIKISEKFDISLDILLKGNEKMVKEMDRKIKNNKKLIMIILSLSILLITIILFLFGHKYLQEEKIRKDNLKYQKIISNIKVLGFGERDGMGFSKIVENNVKYRVYTKMPQALESHIEASTDWSDEEAIVADYSGDEITVTYLNENRATIYCDEQGNLLNDKQNKNFNEIYKKYENRTREIVTRMVELYNEIYK